MTIQFNITTLQLRRDTAANWTTNNPTLASGELGIETDTVQIKIGNGSTAWNSLAYAGIPGLGGATPQSVGTASAGVSAQASRQDHVHGFTDTSHGSRAGGALHANVVASGAAGFMTGTDKSKLDGVATSAAAVGSATPQPPGTATAGVATSSSREDHVHAPPTDAQIGHYSCRVTASQGITGAALVNVTNGSMAVEASTAYSFTFIIRFQTTVATCGMGVSLTVPAGAVITAQVGIHSAADGVASTHWGDISTSGDVVTSATVETLGVDAVAVITGSVIVAGTAGNLQLQARPEVAAQTLTIGIGTVGDMRKIG